MISTLNVNSQRFLNDLQVTQSRQDRAEAALSSGLKLRKASDDPDKVEILLETRSQLAAQQQTKTNIEQYKTEVDASENALQNAVKTLERARVLGAQGLNETSVTNPRPILAEEVSSVFTNLVGASRTASQDRYIFSGDSDQTAPFAINLTQPNGVSAYAGTAGANRLAENSSGVRFSVSKTAQEIFDSSTPGDSVFGAVNGLRVALLANDTTAIKAALANIETASSHLNKELAFYGSVQGQIAESISSGEKYQLSLKEQISNVEGADAAESILELNQSKIALEAAYQTHAQVPRKSLFDYLFN